MNTFIPDSADVPAALRERNQWVCWKYEAREGDDKPTKMPYQAQYPGRKASSNAPNTWASFDMACRTAAKHQMSGVGYVFSVDDPFCGVDLDDVLLPDGSLKPWARPWVAELNTYAEVSPSGQGIKVIALGKLPGAGVNAGDLELYDQGRYFTITGQHLEGTPDEPRNLNGTIDKLYQLAKDKQTQREHQREYARREKYAQAALLGEAEKVKAAPNGMRNDALNRAAFSLSQFLESGLLDEETIAETLNEAAQIAGLGVTEIRATLRSGMKAGSLKPRTVPVNKRTSVTQTVDHDTGEILGGDDWLARGITLATLQHKHFEPLRWVIEDICPEGVTLVAAKPKSKKSWIAMGCGLAVAMGGKALGRLNTNQGRVLYLDLEGNERRVQNRIRAILGSTNTPWPDNFEVHTEWAKGDDCVSRLEQYFIVYPDCRFVVIDLLAEIRPPMDPRANQYDYDRELLVKLNKLGERFGVAILIIHHTRKAKGEDVFDEVSGTLGINGAVSTLWILSRQPDGHVVLNFTGRDIVKDEPLALSWDGFLCSFVIEGTAKEVNVTNERKMVLDLMDDDRPWTPRQIAADLGKSTGAIQQLLRDMLQAGQIDKAGYGKYSKIPSKSGKSSNSSKSGNTSNSYSDTPNSYSTLTDSYHPEVRVGSDTDAVNSPEEPNSYHSYYVSDADTFFDAVPMARRVIVRLYLRSNKDADQVRAQELCEEYGLNYEEAKRHAST